MSAPRVRLRWELALATVVALGVVAPRASAADDVAVRVEVGAELVRPGRPFPLTVVRTWRRGLEPSAWDDRALAPLVVVAAGQDRRTTGDAVEETRRFVAWAFSRTDVRLPAPAFSAAPAGGGTAVVARGKPVRVRVQPVLPAADPGPLEAPDGLLGSAPARPTGAIVAVAAALLVAVVALGLARRRRRARGPVAPPSAPPPPSADVVALGRLEALSHGARDDGPTRRAQVAAAADVVRAYVTARTGARTAERTTSEVLRDPAVAAVLHGPAATALAGVLRAADAVKFADHEPSPGARDATLSAAASLVRATPAPPRPAAPQPEGAPS